MHAQITGAFDGGKIARFLVEIDAVQEIVQQGLCAGCTGFVVKRGQVNVFKVDVGQGWHRQAVLCGPRHQG